MEITKRGGHILLSELLSNELFAFLKSQIQAKIIFIDSFGQRADEDIVLINRNFEGIEVDINEKSQIFSHNELISKISEILQNNYRLEIMLTVDDFKSKEPLIHILSNIRKEIVNSCLYLDYVDNTFIIKNKDFKNGDSDVLYYFELNDTILAFSENGPTLITDNPGINSIEDLIGNK